MGSIIHRREDVVREREVTRVEPLDVAVDLAFGFGLLITVDLSLVVPVGLPLGFALGFALDFVVTFGLALSFDLAAGLIAAFFTALTGFDDPDFFAEELATFWGFPSRVATAAWAAANLAIGTR